MGEHANNDCVPVDAFPIMGCDVEAKDEDNQTKQADGTVGASVSWRGLAGKGTDNNDSNSSGGSNPKSELFWDHVHNSSDNIIPEESNWDQGVSSWDPNRDESNGEGKPQESWNQPSRFGRCIASVKDKAGNPPSAKYELCGQFAMLEIILPGHNHPEEDEDKHLVFLVVHLGLLFASHRTSFVSVH